MILHEKLTIRLFKDEKCFGPGMAELLERVQEYHSLRAAAISMGMAYSKAWTMMKNAEAQLGFSLLRRVTGGVGGGGATLTAEAERLLSLYRTYQEEVGAFARDRFQTLFAELL
ncbi:MAG: LysR family transcriptional regulator [Oscillospiraceae bacterium]|nr:LysR family transcriptional regulator [Oscillospiraceae bacterium]